MKIRNLKTASAAGDATVQDSQADSPQAVAEQRVVATAIADRPADEAGQDRQALEIALLRARVQHLELVVETARSLLSANQDRLLRRLHEVPRELATLSAQLQRVDPQANW
jgi:hypothetical protein